jgi:hypothetical protein
MLHTFLAAVGRIWRWVFHDQPVVMVLAVLIVSIDMLLAGIHAVVMVWWDAPNIWRVDMDNSYAEAYQYLKYVWVIILLAMIAIRGRSWVFAAWIPLFLFFLVDDAIMLHEGVGFWLAGQSWVPSLGPLSPQALGELGFAGLVFLIVAAPVVAAYARADAATRRIFRLMAALLVVLVAFAVAVDVLHSFFVDVRLVDRLLGFIEDFGEMLALSALLVVAIRVDIGAPSTAPEKVATTRTLGATAR